MVRSTTRFAVLGMLSREPMTGYRLRQEIRDSVGHFWQESFGQLYPTLASLAAEGLVRRLGDSGRSTPYELTDAGRHALVTWLEGEATSLASHRNELLLQVFFGRQAPPGVLLGHLARHRARLEQARTTYADLERALVEDPSPDRTYWLITVRHGVALVDAGLRWNAEATALLEAEEAA